MRVQAVAHGLDILARVRVPEHVDDMPFFTWVFFLIVVEIPRCQPTRPLQLIVNSRDRALPIDRLPVSPENATDLYMLQENRFW